MDDPEILRTVYGDDGIEDFYMAQEFIEAVQTYFQGDIQYHFKSYDEVTEHFTFTLTDTIKSIDIDIYIGGDGGVIGVIDLSNIFKANFKINTSHQYLGRDYEEFLRMFGQPDETVAEGVEGTYHGLYYKALGVIIAYSEYNEQQDIQGIFLDETHSLEDTDVSMNLATVIHNQGVGVVKDVQTEGPEKWLFYDRIDYILIYRAEDMTSPVWDIFYGKDYRWLMEEN